MRKALVFALLLSAEVSRADEPAWPVKRDVVDPAAETPPTRVAPSLRGALVGIWSDRDRAELGVDVRVGAFVSRGRLVVLPLAGYSYSGSTGHFVSAGVGVGLRDHSGDLVLVPEVLAGVDSRALRGTLLLAKRDWPLLAIAYQRTWSDTMPVDEISIGIGFELGGAP